MLQAWLSHLGYDVALTDVYDSATRRRVLSYERSRGMRSDGRVSGRQARSIERDVEGSRWVPAANGRALAPEQFGAVGDGARNDTAAVQAAIDAAAASRGSTVQLQAGRTYLVSGLNVRSGVRLVGPGARLLQRRMDTPALQVPADAEAVLLDGFEVDGGGRSLGASAVTIAGARVRLDGLHVFNSHGHGVHVLNGARDVVVQDLVVEDTGSRERGAGVAVGSEGGGEPPRRVLVKGCRVARTGKAGLSIHRSAVGVTMAENSIAHTGIGGDGIAAYGSANRDSIYVANRVTTAGNNGLHVGGDDLTVVGNRISGAEQRGISVSSNSLTAGSPPAEASGALVRRNSIYKARGRSGTGYGLQIQRYTRATVEDNRVVSSAKSGIVIAATRYFRVEDNYVRRSASGSGIMVTASRDGSVAGNDVLYNRLDGIHLAAGAREAGRRRFVARVRIVRNRARGNRYGVYVAARLSRVSIRDNDLSPRGVRYRNRGR